MSDLHEDAVEVDSMHFIRNPKYNCAYLIKERKRSFVLEMPIESTAAGVPIAEWWAVNEAGFSKRAKVTFLGFVA